MCYAVSMDQPQKTILIVEDERSLADALAEKFGKHGFAADIALDGDRAMDRLRQKTYDAVLLDLLLPAKDGFAVLEEMKATPNAAAPVYVLTALGQEEHLLRAKELGAKQCFVKSLIPIADVMKCIEHDLGMQSK